MNFQSECSYSHNNSNINSSNSNRNNTNNNDISILNPTTSEMPPSYNNIFECNRSSKDQKLPSYNEVVINNLNDLISKPN